MRFKLLAIFTLLPAAVNAHRLNEYLQAAMVSISPDRVQVSMRLIPGVAVTSVVIAAIDINGDGVFSATEQRAYAQDVLRDVSLSLDGRALAPRVEGWAFPPLSDIKEGMGEIRVAFIADVPVGSSRRTLVVENHHAKGPAVYLMNCLVPDNSAIRLLAQSRNRDQSRYELSYAQGAEDANAWLVVWWPLLAANFAF